MNELFGNTYNYYVTQGDQPRAQYYRYILYNNQKYYLDTSVNNAVNRTYSGVPIFTLEKNVREFITEEKLKELKDYLGLSATDDITAERNFRDVNAFYYYYNAYKFSKEVEPILKRINVGNVKTETYKKEYEDEDGVSSHIKSIYNTPNVFDTTKSGNDPELASSAFNMHRIDVIISSIESSLMAIIENFSPETTSTGFGYKMPILEESDWDKICNNLTVVSFMQGLTIGNYKYYTSHKVVANTKTKDFVSRESIFVQEFNENSITDGEYHNPKCSTLNSGAYTQLVGYNKLDYERQDFTKLDINNVQDTLTGGYTDTYGVELPTYYYYLHKFTGAYECVIGQNQNDYTADELISGSNGGININVRKAYIAALAREKGNHYKTYSFLNT